MSGTNRTILSQVTAAKGNEAALAAALKNANKAVVAAPKKKAKK